MSIALETPATIFNANRSPETTAVLNGIAQAGHSFQQTATTLHINPTRGTEPTSLEVPLDKIEALTLLLGGPITNGTIWVDSDCSDVLLPLLPALSHLGLTLEKIQNSSLTRLTRTETSPPNVDIHATLDTNVDADWLPLLAAYAITTGTGYARFTDTYNPSRNKSLAAQLSRLGGEAQEPDPRSIAFARGQRLRGGRAFASDLRTGAALALAALTCESEVIIDNYSQVARGYDNLARKLGALGAEVASISTEEVKL